MKKKTVLFRGCGRASRTSNKPYPVVPPPTCYTGVAQSEVVLLSHRVSALTKQCRKTKARQTDDSCPIIPAHVSLRERPQTGEPMATETAAKRVEVSGFAYRAPASAVKGSNGRAGVSAYRYHYRHLH